MKYLISIILSILAFAANAQHHGHRYDHHYHHNRGGHNWVAPLVIGGLVTYAITRPQQLPPPGVVYQPTALPPPPYGYHYEQILDANCNCYRWVLVQG
jgi:hypothetical protein